MSYPLPDQVQPFPVLRNRVRANKSLVLQNEERKSRLELGRARNNREKSHGDRFAQDWVAHHSIIGLCRQPRWASLLRSEVANIPGRFPAAMFPLEAERPLGLTFDY
jgi:hypothetical protein